MICNSPQMLNNEELTSRNNPRKYFLYENNTEDDDYSRAIYEKFLKRKT